jgi:Undecaprenyl-phosphate galactose phosphotransferase, WbaP/exopolysaccharide biosynthesis polyprenyl glycosylphosphotransferase
MTLLDEVVGNTGEFRRRSFRSFARERVIAAGKSLSPIRALVFCSQILADVLSLATAIGCSGLLAYGVSVNLIGADYRGFAIDPLLHRLVVWSGMVTIVILWFCLKGHYAQRRPLHDDFKSVTGILAVMFLLDGYVEFATRTQFSRLWILFVWPIALVTIPFGRILVRRLLDMAGCWRIGALVIGSGDHATSLTQLLGADRYVGYFMAGSSSLFAELDKPHEIICNVLKQEMRRARSEFVIVAPSDTEIRDFATLADILNHLLIPYYLVPPVQKLPLYGLTIRTMFNSDAIFLSYRSGLMSPVRQWMKRVFDVAVSLILLILLAPLFAALSIIIAGDGGSPIYGHRRVGRNGRSFRCWKFRSMQRNADAILAELLEKDAAVAKQWYSNFKLENDPRITAVGRFLRKTSLDELPQLWNVLIGEMSLVGPRPVVEAELDRYYGEDAFYYTLVRPGMTGLWQVSGRSSTSYERRVFLDSWYVRNWTLWTDTVIFFETIPSVLAQRGAV